MNKKDRMNLKFVLMKFKEGDDVLEDWLNTLSDDDLAYTVELLRDLVTAQQKMASML